MKALFKTTGGSWSSISPFPIAGQLKGYTRGKLASDFRAGFNVAVLSFPVNMAYALVAGLPISYGIFSGIVAAIIGLLLCNSVYLTFGPSNATAVMLLSSFAAGGIATEAECGGGAPSGCVLVKARGQPHAVGELQAHHPYRLFGLYKRESFHQLSKRRNRTHDLPDVQTQIVSELRILREKNRADDIFVKLVHLAKN